MTPHLDFMALAAAPARISPPTLPSTIAVPNPAPTSPGVIPNLRMSMIGSHVKTADAPSITKPKGTNTAEIAFQFAARYARKFSSGSSMAVAVDMGAEIGRAACRERVGQYVEFAVVA